MSKPTPETAPDDPIDVLIIGAGPAGLACASGLSRLLHTYILFSNEYYRNADSPHMHGVLTWEHRKPVDFRAAARKDISAHYDTVFFEDVQINVIEKINTEEGEGTLFKVIDERGRVWWGRKVVLATGVTDEMLDIEGYENCWVKGIFHCLFCHGYEERGAPSAGVLAIADCAPPHVALHLARFANRLAETVTIYTNGSDTVTTSVSEALGQCKATSKTKQKVSIESRKITKFVKLPKNAQVEVFFEDGKSKIEGFLAHKPKGKVDQDFVDQLGLELTEQGDIKVNEPFKESTVRGVFAGGDCQTPMKAATMAMMGGGAMAAGAAVQLETED